ncbi:MAG: SDR family NAD(P)-dependent oxidoreductase [Candidatus Shapirobacteria bacterium]|jgi:NAD(P)-dependent dehydrogenase (short-subunit alcohol dehydrogenase family)
MNLTNKVVVIVGGSQGFGKSLAKLFINEGAKVAIISKNKSTVELTAQEIGVIPFVADVRSEESLNQVATEIVNMLGNIDIWINSAGVFMKFPNNEPLNMDRAREMFDVNFFGTVLGSKVAISHLNKDGSIINILSSAALDATRAIGASLYASSKWAVRGYTDALRAENKDINVFSIYPGGMKTHLHDEAIPAEFNNFMNPDYVSAKVIDNLKLDKPELELIIKRPSA